jgi:hypothetical protein
VVQRGDSWVQWNGAGIAGGCAGGFSALGPALHGAMEVLPLGSPITAHQRDRSQRSTSPIHTSAPRMPLKPHRPPGRSGPPPASRDHWGVGRGGRGGGGGVRGCGSARGAARGMGLFWPFPEGPGFRGSRPGGRSRKLRPIDTDVIVIPPSTPALPAQSRTHARTHTHTTPHLESRLSASCSTSSCRASRTWGGGGGRRRAP